MQPRETYNREIDYKGNRLVVKDLHRELAND